MDSRNLSREIDTPNSMSLTERFRRYMYNYLKSMTTVSVSSVCHLHGTTLTSGLHNFSKKKILKDYSTIVMLEESYYSRSVKVVKWCDGVLTAIEMICMCCMFEFKRKNFEALVK